MTPDGKGFNVVARVDCLDVLRHVVMFRCATHGFTVLRFGSAVRAMDDGPRVADCRSCDAVAEQAVNAAFES